FECDKNRSRRTAMLTATLAMAPINAFRLTSGNKTDGAAEAAAFVLVGRATHDLDPPSEGPPQKRRSFTVGLSALIGLTFSEFRRDPKVNLLLRPNSRFGRFNSRLGAHEFPFGRLRELASKALIWLPVFGTGTAHFGKKTKNSRFCGNNRELVRLL